MPPRKHGRQYDLVVFGATGYTGKLAAEHITTHLPTDIRWAVAGRRRDKLEQVASHCKSLNPDRQQPEIEVCALDDDELSALAVKTFILASTVGPYGRYGEPAFRACAENGTHYIDVTGEVAFVARMIKKYEGAAKASGALMFPECGIESAPADLVTWSLASALRSELFAPTQDVIVSLHKLKAAPSGGTLASALSLLENFSTDELRAAHRPFALSPVPNPRPTSPPRSLLTRLTGLVTYPLLGLQTSCLTARTDAAIVGRTWGLLSTMPPSSRLAGFTYGPRFSFREQMRAASRLGGVAMHYGIFAFGLVLAIPPLRALVRRFVYQPGDGPSAADSANDQIEYRGIADPDTPGELEKRAFCRAWFDGNMYYLTGVLIAQAALTILEDDNGLPGGIYTPACLGQGFIDRLDKAGFHFETKITPV